MSDVGAALHLTRWRISFSVALLAVAVLALREADDAIDWFAHADKLRHVAAFLTLGLLGRRARAGRGWLLALGLIAFGGAIELAQGLLTATRQASWGDLGADAVGVACAIVVSRRWMGERA